MQECGTSTGKSSFVKRVSVRSGGAGHAHSGVAKTNGVDNRNAAVAKATKAKIVKLGR
jgi:hypothetical protein